jgi:hypothetical protein
MYFRNLKKSIFEKMIKMKSDVLKLFRAAVGAVDPYACVKHHLVFNNNHSNDEKKGLHIGDNYIPLNHNLYVAAFGKAALGTRESIKRNINYMFFIFNKACVELWMNSAMNILLEALQVFLLEQLNKLKGKILIYIYLF